MKIQNAVWAGFLFGSGMGVFFGIETASIKGGLFGFVFGWASFAIGLALFENSRIIKKQTSIGDDVLLDGETVLYQEPANFVVKLQEHGLKRFAFDNWNWVVGMKGKEALGGRIYLTNYRLIFKTHNVNRLNGITSIFLFLIIDQRNSSFFVARKMTLETHTAKMDFTLFNPNKLIEKIKAAKTQLQASQIERIRVLAMENPDKISENLTTNKSINTINDLVAIGNTSNGVLELVTSPLSTISGMLFKELSDRSIVEKWNKQFDK